MSITILSTKGQLVLPKELRDRHGWTAGMSFEVEDLGHAIVLRPVLDVAPTKADEVIGCLRHEGPPKTLEDMEEAITKGARGE